ncbi:phage tail sheath subtilisin-like domain-containing protein [Myxococcus sp. CA039A]|uniref:phage tail sheath subtilisin-like domain-containing protein n=1 Tax=Myxococcus sp. CA039A TaxID=2741737 RepID=UPI00157A967A|nr:phage tail sheath family protein [Myxococcus sp. CA039A]
MSPELLSSKVVVVEEEPRVRGIPSAPTSVAGAVGLAERGPIGKPVLCTSMEDYQATFGGFTPDSDLALAAMGFFENGGSHLWAVRTVHYEDATNPESHTATRATAALTTGGGPTPAVAWGTLRPPFSLADGQRMEVAVNGSAAVDVAFLGTAASVLASRPGPYALTSGQALRVRVDGARDVFVSFSDGDFADMSQATPEEVAAVLNAVLVGGSATVEAGALRISSDTFGAASRLEVGDEVANAVFGFPLGPQVGTGNVQSLRAVELHEVQSLVEAAVAGVRVEASSLGTLQLRTTITGPSASLRVQGGAGLGLGLDALLHQGAASGDMDVLRLEAKDAGAYANRLEVEVRPSTSGTPDAFDILILEDGAYRESFPNLSSSEGDARYIGRVLNDGRTGSRYVQVFLVEPDAVPDVQTVALSGGADGLVGLRDSDFIGSEVVKTGLYALDSVQELSLLLVPGRATPAVHNAMVRYCEVARDGLVFAILDSPAGYTATDIVSYIAEEAALEGLSEHAALYWPRVKVLNPSRGVFGNIEQLVVPPSGLIAGVFARNDAARPGGVYDSPAGIEAGRMLGVLGFETSEVLEEKKRDVVYPHRVNPLTTGPGLPRYIDGSRTLKAGGNFPYVAERRGVSFIERSLQAGLQFARHRNNTEGLRAQVRRFITAFLLTQMRNGAFRSMEPAKAFFVDVSNALNPPSVVFAGQLVVRVGLATNKPAEYVVLRISQDTRALEAELASAGA